MSERNIYHMCNLSPVILFRQVEDYLVAISRLAACSRTFLVDVLAYCIMSTHYHLILRGEYDDVLKFLNVYRRNIIVRHNSTYNSSMGTSVTCKQLIGDEAVIAGINYVLKNPIHHGIKSTAFSYPYSSTSCYFSNDFIREDYFQAEKIQARYNKPSDLLARDYKKLFVGHEVPDTFRIISNRMIVPETFVASKYVETIYSTPRNFAYQMNKPLKEDLYLLGNDIEAINHQVSKTDLTGQISDIKACEIMDNYIAPRTYAQIKDEDKSNLWKYLKRNGINYSQFQRMLL